MKQDTIKPEIYGTRTGYVIRFTCPACHSENIIVSKTPRDHFKETHNASCKKCRKRSVILTPYTNNKMEYYPVSEFGRHNQTVQ